MKRLLALSSAGLVSGSRYLTHSEGANSNGDHRVHQPSFSAGSSTARVQSQRKKAFSEVTLDSLVLITGSAHKELSQEISDLIKVPIADATLARFADGEVNLQINQNIRGKDVVVIQPCAAPVNDSIMELLLTVSCARRAGARRIVAVIPYFGYKHHRRGSAISTKHHSRFLSSGAMDFAKMLQEMGVDRVIAVDLQRPGQGLEACFFDNGVPLETIVTTDLFVDYFTKTPNGIKLQEPILVVTPNAEGVKKARVFQRGLQKHFKNEIKVTTFFAADTGSGRADAAKLDLLANTKV
jgi:ribose-phosphate pyrophosphokinase